MSTSAFFGDEQRQTSPLQLVVEGSQGPYTVLHVGGDVDLYTAARLGAALVLLAGAGKHVDIGGTKVLAVRLSPAGEVEAWPGCGPRCAPVTSSKMEPLQDAFADFVEAPEARRIRVVPAQLGKRREPWEPLC